MGRKSKKKRERRESRESGTQARQEIVGSGIIEDMKIYRQEPVSRTYENPDTKQEKPEQNRVPFYRSALGFVGKVSAALLITLGLAAGSNALIGKLMDNKTVNTNSPPGIERTYDREEARRIFDSFPENIPGAGKIEKYGEKDPDFCLVHVRDKHYVQKEQLEQYGADGSTIKTDHTNKVQGENYQILLYLTNWVNTRYIFCEGLTPEVKFLMDMDPDKTKEILSSDDEIPAVSRLYLEGKVELHSGDTSESRRLKKERVIDYAATNDSTVYNESEDKVLELLAQSKYPVKILLYGAAHSFRDNVEKYNKKNPEKPISLIEVSPKSIDL